MTTKSLRQQARIQKEGVKMSDSSEKKLNNLEVLRLVEQNTPASLDEILSKRLTQKRKKLSSALAYDEEGSNRFDKLCSTPEYYLYKTEEKLLKMFSSNVIRHKNFKNIIDLGCGTMEKSFSFIYELSKNDTYIDVFACDIDEYISVNSCHRLSKFFSDKVNFIPVIGDFNECIYSLQYKTESKLISFLGSTLGNLDKSEQDAMFLALSESMNREDNFLVGVDLVKNKDILEDAYRDSEGLVTANIINMIKNLNKWYGSNFNPDEFEHIVRFESDRSSVISYLRARRAISEFIPGLGIILNLEEGELIEAEIREKFSLSQFILELDRFNLFPIEISVDPDWHMALILVKLKK